MTNDEVMTRLRQEAGRHAPRGARKRVQQETGLSYNYLCRLVEGRIANPGSKQLDVLRRRYEQRS